MKKLIIVGAIFIGINVYSFGALEDADKKPPRAVGFDIFDAYVRLTPDL